MYLVYLDESGNTGRKTDDMHQPIHWLGALVASADQVRKVEEAVRRIALDRVGIVSVNTNFEFHGYDIFKGHGYFRKMDFPERLKVLRDLLSIIQDYKLTLFFEGIHKPRLAGKYSNPYHPHNLAFLFIVEKVEGFLAEKKAWGLVIADENRERSNQIIQDFRGYKEIGTAFGYKPQPVEHFVDNVHFVASQNSPLIQLADCATFCWNRAYSSQLKEASQQTASDHAAIGLRRLLTSVVGDSRIWPRE